MSPAPMIGGRVRRRIERPDPAVIAALAPFPSGLISDCLNRMGAMDGAIRSLVAGRRCCGPAVTVEEVEGGNMMSHAALELLEPGDVLVIAGRGVTSRAAWGGVQSLAAERRGAVAVVIDGSVRDVGDLAALEIALFARGTAPGGPLKGWGGNVNQPIAVGGTVVQPGDLVCGDDDGVVVVPRALAPELPELCAARAAMEAEWIARVESGALSLDAVGLRETRDALPIRYE